MAPPSLATSPIGNFPELWSFVKTNYFYGPKDIGQVYYEEYQPGCDGGTVEDIEKGSSYPKQIGKTVEAKVDQMSCQLHNLHVKYFSVKFILCVCYTSKVSLFCSGSLKVHILSTTFLS